MVGRQWLPFRWWGLCHVSLSECPKLLWVSSKFFGEEVTRIVFTTNMVDVNCLIADALSSGILTYSDMAQSFYRS